EGSLRESQEAARASARQALLLFDVSIDSAGLPRNKWLLPAQEPRLADALYEVLLILAEATAGSALAAPPVNDAQRRQAREALPILARAERLGRAPAGTIHRRRARLLERLGEREEAEREHRRAAALPPATALEWFQSGLDRWAEQDLAGA